MSLKGSKTVWCQDWQVWADQFLERLGEGQDAVGDGLLVGQRNTVCFFSSRKTSVVTYAS